jgi:anti-sigma B factor antagonist
MPEVSAMRLSLRFQIYRGIPVLGVAGDLDLATASSLRDACLALVSFGHHVLVVDLQSVALLDSFALDILVGALNRARALGGDLRLICNQGHIRRMLTVTGLDQLFTIYHSREAMPGTMASHGAAMPGTVGAPVTTLVTGDPTGHLTRTTGREPR